MGLLIEGEWHDHWYDTEKSAGEFIRQQSLFRNWITRDGSAGPTGTSGFKAEPDRYHLYVAMACPWAHRTLIFRKLKNLEDIISVSVVHPDMLENGWELKNKHCTSTDFVNHCDYLYQIYKLADKHFNGRVTVPVLWDKKKKTIVNNESSEIIRMFNSEFCDFTDDDYDYYPVELSGKIDEINNKIYHHVNNGVYKCGFATNQEVYEHSFIKLFATLDEMERLLANQRYLLGDLITEADWRFFTTLLRFDLVYYGHFKCNSKRIADYPNLMEYLRELYQYPGIIQTIDLEQIKRHYYYSHNTINPNRIVPLGPEVQLSIPHKRNLF